MIKKWYIDLIKNKKRILVAMHAGVARYNCELQPAFRLRSTLMARSFDTSTSLSTLRILVMCLNHGVKRFLRPFGFAQGAQDKTLLFSVFLLRHDAVIYDYW